MPDIRYSKTDPAEREDYWIAQRKARRARLWLLADEGKTWPEVIEAEKVSRQALFKFCTAYDEPLLEKINANTRLRNERTHGPEEIVFILKCLAGVEAGKWSQAYIAHMLGVTDGAVSNWRRKHAPFGVEDALELYIEDEEELYWFYRQLSRVETIGNIYAKWRPRGPNKNPTTPAYARRKQQREARELELARLRNESETDVSPQMNLNPTFCPA